MEKCLNRNRTLQKQLKLRPGGGITKTDLTPENFVDSFGSRPPPNDDVVEKRIIFLLFSFFLSDKIDFCFQKEKKKQKKSEKPLTILLLQRDRNRKQKGKKYKEMERT